MKGEQKVPGAERPWKEQDNPQRSSHAFDELVVWKAPGSLFNVVQHVSKQN
jgi:hypothetical protein